MKQILDPVEHLAWAMPGINIYWEKFRKTGDIRDGQQALEYARHLDKQWRSILESLEKGVGAGESVSTPTAAAPSREEIGQSAGAVSAPLVSA